MNEKERLQRNLGLIRTSIGWSAQDLADRLGVTRQTVNSMEKEGNELTNMQYLAIRKLLDDEVASSKKMSGDDSVILEALLDVLVDHPENYTPEEYNEVLSKSRLIAPAIMKQPKEKKTLSNAWKAVILGSGIVVSAALAAFLKD